MKHTYIRKTFSPLLLGFLFFTCSFAAKAQITPGVYMHTAVVDGTETTHEIKLTDDYLIYTVYQEQPADFSKTLGGFYTSQGQQLKVDLEFNSNFESDGMKTWSAPYSMKAKDLVLELGSTMVFEPKANEVQALDGAWLFATRGPDEGQERRGEGNTRKTLKFLKDGTFQWIAYDTDSFRFSGTGGGSYAAQDGIYTEQIEFFSRDNERVGATLKFDYDVQGNDWHHTGTNSRGEPLYEIWAKR